MKRRAVVTGVGVVTSLGRKVDVFWDRIVRGDSGVGPITLFDVSGYRVQFGGQVHWEPENEDICTAKDLKRLDRFTQFAIGAAKDAAADSGIDFSKEEPYRCGVVIGSGIGGLWEFETQEERMLHKGIDKVSPFTIPKLMVNSASGHVSALYGAKGPNFAVATACAAGHITQPDEEGRGGAHAMTMALQDAGIGPEVVDYINAHGTSTPLGDVAETKAVKRVFGGHAKRLAISSTKSHLGHTLGASGGIEAVVCSLTISRGVITPTINLDTPDPECDLDYVPKVARDAKVDVAMSNSFGFGGHNGSLVFARI